MVSTAAPVASPPGVSDCFSPGAATAATTASFLRLAATTTSSTPAIPARHPARRLTSNAHSGGPNARAVARVTRKVCAGWASLPVNKPARIAGGGGDSRSENYYLERHGENVTVDDPAFDFGWGHLQRGGDVRVW